MTILLLIYLMGGAGTAGFVAGQCTETDASKADCATAAAVTGVAWPVVVPAVLVVNELFEDAFH